MLFIRNTRKSAERNCPSTPAKERLLLRDYCRRRPTQHKVY